MVLAGLVTATGCTRLSDVAERAAEAIPTSSPAAMRLTKPELLWGRWPESLDRRLHLQAQQAMGGFKQLLDGEPTSAVGTAYTLSAEEYSAERGVHSPDGQRAVLISGVSGRVVAPEATLDTVFAGLTRLRGVTPTEPGPLGGVARCGAGENKGVPVDVCAWADGHTIGMVIFIGFPRAQSRSEDFLKTRSQMEQPAR
ncbi:hypothetical protein ABGB16_01635 [Micromonospora sp. B11E3]|uniref:hypothetical protein n=1 Tax=Micromonospora sp. B11E3 TaxID=3153562 RepID=UPI00325CB870